jgi:4-hydroxybenzoyl-CoA thioesterase
MAAFKTRRLVRMQHCDPGGVVFTPQYFNLFVEVIEDWFREGVGFSFAQMVSEKHHGLPAMRITARFLKPSKLGEELDFTLRVKRLRKNNMLIGVDAACGGERRVSADFLHGFAGLAEMSLADWPDHVKKKLEEYKDDNLPNQKNTTGR